MELVTVPWFPGENTALCRDAATGTSHLWNHTRSLSGRCRSAKWRFRHLTPALSPIEAEREGAQRRLVLRAVAEEDVRG